MTKTDASSEIQTAAEVAESAVFPQAHAVHSDPNAPQTAEQKPLPASMGRKPVEKKSAAEWAYERLVLYIKNFEEQLDGEHEVAMGFAGSDMGVLRIEGMGFFDPDVLTFYGTDDGGSKTQLIQHVSQLNVMLRTLPKAEPERQANRIGFRLVDDLENSSAT
jgi:hypothetical protein